MNIICIIQARVNSKRLHSKSILPLYKNFSSLDILIKKFKKLKEINKIYIASGSLKKNIKIFKKFNKNKKINLFFGKEKDVRSRFELIQKKEKSDLVVRVTADNPLTDIDLIKYLIDIIKKNQNISYLYVNKKYVSPGFAAEVFRTNYFFKFLETDQSNKAREHVTVHIKNKKKSKLIIPPKRFITPSIRVTMDTLSDYQYLKKIFTLIKNPDIKLINKNYEKLLLI